MVRVRNSAGCAICEFVMKQLESMLEDQTTEVRCVLLDVSNMTTKICKSATKVVLVQLVVFWCQADPFVFVSGGGDSSCGEGVHIPARLSEGPV